MSPWWEDAVIYQVYPRSFADSNGDGIGDLAGVTAHLTYLKKLGVDALWLTPFYTSPMADGGYDIANFTDVDPRFGTLEDFDTLVSTAHSAGLRILVDIVPNHSSDQHEWFQAALAAAPGSPERERYIFRTSETDQPPTNWQSYFGGSTWEKLDDGDWYMHAFAVEQPDFNWDHPDVKSAFIRTLRFWADRGVDGFRIDVAHGMAKDLDPLVNIEDVELVDNMLEAKSDTRHPFINVPKVHDIYRSWRTQVLDTYDPPRMAVAEAWVPLPELTKYVRKDELDQAFGFEFLLSEFDATSYREIIQTTVAALGAERTTWVLSNHDVVRHASRFALASVDDANDWVNHHGEKPASDSKLGRLRARAAVLLLLALPGAIYLYQGEELGLPEVPNLPDELLEDPTFARTDHKVRGRDGCRVPLPWTQDGPSFGFSTGPGWLPQPDAFASLSVATQSDNPESMLNLYRAAIALRRSNFSGNDITWPQLANTTNVLTMIRGTSTAVVINTGDTPVELASIGVRGNIVLASSSLVTDKMLPGNSAAWVSLD